MRIVAIVLFMLMSRLVIAAQCEAVFPSVLQGHSDNSRLTVDAGAKVNNAPSTVLPFVAGSINSFTGTSCGSADCSVSGFPSEPVNLNSFPSFSGRSYNSYGGVLGQGNANYQTFNSINALSGTTSFSSNYSQYFIQSLSINAGAKVAMKPGIYWIRTININASSTANDVAIEVVGSGTVYLVVENLYINNNRVIDGITNDALLSLNTYGNLTLSTVSAISALLYADGTVYVNSGSVFDGAIAAANVVLNTNSTVNYRANLLSDFDLSALCNSAADTQLKLQYQFDQDSWVNAGDVIDTSGNEFNGTAIGSATPQSYDGGSCRILDIPANTTQAQVDAVDTHLDMNNVGDTGSISFWYRSDLSWSDPTMRQLFDASNDLTSPYKHFYMSLGDGTLQFSIEDENDVGAFATLPNIHADPYEWVHITATWDLPNKRLQIYLNTSDFAGSWYLDNPNLANNMGDLASLYIGDSRSSYFLERSTVNSAHGQFESFNIFNYVLTNNEARTIAEATPSCNGQDAKLIAHWPVNVCSLDGTTGEVVDIVGGHNGQAVDGASATEQGKFCQAGDFAGSGEHINIPHSDAVELNDGSISLWFNTPDLSHTNDSSRNGMALFSKDSNGFDNGGHLTAYVETDGSIHVRHQSSSKSNYLNSANHLVQENQWQHLVYTFGGAGAKLYLNNNLVASRNYTEGISSNLEPIILGSGAWYTGDGVSDPVDLRDHFIGQIDDIKIYDGQLSTTQVSNLYNQQAGVCVDCNPVLQLAQYSFEQDIWDSAGDILDSTANANHATAIGQILPLYPSEQVACRVMDVPASSAISSEFNAMDTGIDIDTLDSRGTISFWYRSNEAWDSGGARQLFDASTELGDVNLSKYFYLAITSSGKLDFNMEDENDRNFGASTNNSLTYPADQWVHIALSWDLSAQSIKIYLDGVPQLLTNLSESGLSSQPGAFNTLYIGDNRTSYLALSSTQNSANGQFDDVRIYSYVQSSQEISTDINDTSTCSYVYKYLIEHDGNGLTCEAEPVTIKACANESCSQLFSQQHSISMLPDTGWPQGGTVTIPAGAAANVSYSQTTAGVYTFAVPGELTQCTGTANNSCSITFADAGFQFFGANTDQNFADQLAEATFSSANIRAVKIDDENGTNQCVAALSGAQVVDFSMSCDDPTSCQRPVKVGTSTISDATYTPINLTFDSDGVASLEQFVYSDAGKVSLYARAQIDDSAVAVGNTQFVVYPERLVLESDLVPQSAAGEDFGLTIYAVGHAGGQLVNYQPEDMYIWLQRLAPIGDQSVDGILTYAQSGTLNSSQNPVFSRSIIAKGQANIGISNGIISFAAYYDEFGSVAFDVRDQNYFGHVVGTSANNGTNPVVLGTFTPAYYDVIDNAPELLSTCSVASAFSYLGQDVDFGLDPELTITAKNALGSSMANFYSAANWAWLSNVDSAAIEFTDSQFSGDISYYLTPDMLVSDIGVQGSQKLTIANGSVIYDKSASVVAPFDSALIVNLLPSFLTDTTHGRDICYHQSYTKGVPDDCDDGHAINSLDDTNNLKSVVVSDNTQFRWGRLRIENGFGPENQDMLLNVHTEYFNGNNFIPNDDDSCSQFSFSNSDFNLFDSSNNPTAAISIVDSEFTLKNGINSDFEGLGVHNVDPSVSGEYRIELLPINDDTITWDDYLQFDWNGVETGDANPSALVSFGQFKGNDRIIYWREITN